MRQYLSIFVLLFLSLGLHATHIVGGEMFYDYLGNDMYRITLKVYRDCSVNTNFDGTGGNTSPAYITVFNSANTILNIYDIGTPQISAVPPVINNPCNQPPNGTCVEEGIYTYTLTLPPQAGGYTIVYQRCCRNAGVANLVFSDGEGSTYFTKIPGPEDAVHNSSPRFTKFPPIYICNNVPLSFQHVATDPDGDELVYSLSAPYTGLDPCCPSIAIAGTPSSFDDCPSPPAFCPQAASPPPYLHVLFASPYSGSYPIDSNPAFAIDPLTGELTGKPNFNGQFVVGVMVKEYRNNKLINTHFRDFQFTVVVCNIVAMSLVVEQKQKCQGLAITFTNQSLSSTPNPIFHWDFGVPGIAGDTSNLVNPSYTYADTGLYTLTLITNPGMPCSDTLKKPVYAFPPLGINYALPPSQCFRNNSFTFKAGGAYLPNAFFSWDFTARATPSFSALKDPSGVHFTESGLFYVKLKARQFACRDSFVDTVRIGGGAKAKMGPMQNDVCEPAVITFSNSSSSDLPVKYNWKFSNGQTSADFEPVQLFSFPGNHTATLVVEITQVCRDTFMAVTNVKVKPKPTAAFNIIPKETTILEPYVSINANSYEPFVSMEFDFGDGQQSALPQSIHYFPNYGKYLVTQTVMNSYGCRDTISDSLTVLPDFVFWIPNTFTPDDNGRNDIFRPVMAGIKKFEFEVFNRWGDGIFRTTEMGEGWNGTYKGSQSPQGIYTWKIIFTNLLTQKQETRLGTVTLIRNQ